MHVAARKLALLQNGTLLIVGDENGTISVFNVRTADLLSCYVVAPSACELCVASYLAHHWTRGAGFSPCPRILREWEAGHAVRVQEGAARRAVHDRGGRGVRCHGRNPRRFSLRDEHHCSCRIRFIATCLFATQAFFSCHGDSLQTNHHALRGDEERRSDRLGTGLLWQCGLSPDSFIHDDLIVQSITEKGLTDPNRLERISVPPFVLSSFRR